MSKWNTSLKHQIMSFPGSVGDTASQCVLLSWKGTNPWKNSHTLEHLKGSVRRGKKRNFPELQRRKTVQSVGSCRLSGGHGMGDRQGRLDGFRRSVSSLSINNGFLNMTFSEWNSPKSREHICCFTDWHSVTHMCFGFICSSYELPKSRGGWKNFYEIEMYCFVVSLWLPNLFSRSLIKWDVKDSQHKYHLLNEATKVKSVETACSLACPWKSEKQDEAAKVMESTWSSMWDSSGGHGFASWCY